MRHAKIDTQDILQNYTQKIHKLQKLQEGDVVMPIS